MYSYKYVHIPQIDVYKRQDVDYVKSVLVFEEDADENEDSSN